MDFTRPYTTPELSLGSTGADVARWQKLLGTVSIDGNFGPLTQRSTMGMQATHGIPVTGIVRELEWDTLLQPSVVPVPPEGGSGYMADLLTEANTAQMFDAFRDALMPFCPNAPDRDTVFVPLCQWALETGGGSSMHCWNIGNIKHVPGDDREWTMYACHEKINGVLLSFSPPHPQTWFRAYFSLEDGVMDYIETLHKRFDKCWPAVLSGSLSDFAHALKEQHYYSADEGPYADRLMWWRRVLDSQIP